METKFVYRVRTYGDPGWAGGLVLADDMNDAIDKAKEKWDEPSQVEISRLGVVEVDT